MAPRVSRHTPPPLRAHPVLLNRSLHAVAPTPSPSQRLGFLHVYSCLADPHGISFSLDLGEPEQRDIARELVRMAVRETTRAKQESRSRGGMYSAVSEDDARGRPGCGGE